MKGMNSKMPTSKAASSLRPEPIYFAKFDFTAHIWSETIFYQFVLSSPSNIFPPPTLFSIHFIISISAYKSGPLAATKVVFFL